MPYLRPAVSLCLCALFIAPVQAQSTDESDTHNTSYHVLLKDVWQRVNDIYFNNNFNKDDWSTVYDTASRASFSSSEEVHDAIENLLNRLHDPALRFLEQEAFEELLQDLSGTAAPGLGLTELLSIDIDERTRRLTIITPRPDTPAARAGLRPFDIIVAIDGVPTEGLPLHEASALLRGAAQTEVTLSLERDGNLFEVTLTRVDLPALSPVVRSMYKDEQGTRVGYVGLLQFTEEAAEEMRTALIALLDQQVEGFVLDLRNNPGGLLAQSTAIADLLLPSGTPLGEILAREGNGTVLLTTEAALTDKPLIVLVNEGTASAAEMLAGALQASGRALVIGAPTFGKGLVHQPQVLNDGSALLIPSGRLVTPTGRDILKDGIAPDLIVEASSSPVLTPERIPLASAGDLPYRHAVDALKARLAAR